MQETDWLTILMIFIHMRYILKRNANRGYFKGLNVPYSRLRNRIAYNCIASRKTCTRNIYLSHKFPSNRHRTVGILSSTHEAQ